MHVNRGVHTKFTFKWGMLIWSPLHMHALQEGHNDSTNGKAPFTIWEEIIACKRTSHSSILTVIYVLCTNRGLWSWFQLHIIEKIVTWDNLRLKFYQPQEKDESDCHFNIQPCLDIVIEVLSNCKFFSRPSGTSFYSSYITLKNWIRSNGGTHSNANGMSATICSSP